MPLESGRSLAHYRLAAKIGEGGMGVVWRASDMTLGRDVALKVLPEAFARDPERMARFEREARLLAALNHPNIASIHGLDSAEGVRFLVMELVDGEDLATRLSRGPMPVTEALAAARQVAEALEAAHERGIVHRDLKPANIKLTADGRVKVLDFGLAKALEGDPSSGASASDLSQSPTITGPMTSANVILGTAAYMSPEQARGHAVDRRADVWAFGVVLFEMLTGKQLFHGETTSDTLAAVLKTDPDWNALPRATPPRVRALLARCLERNSRRRLRDIGEARVLLEDVIAGTGTEEPAGPPAAAKGGGIGAAALLAGGLVAGIVVAVLFARITARPPAEAPMRRFIVATGDEQGQTPSDPAVSRDGRMIAFVRNDKLWVQALDEFEPRERPALPGVRRPFWSPDGRWVGFIAGTRVMKTSVEGGEPQTICDARGSFTGGSGAGWTDRGTIVCSRGETDGVLEASELGGDPRTIVLPDSGSESDLHEPSALPGGRGVLFVPHRREGYDTIELIVNGKRKRILRLPGQSLNNPIYSPTGHLLFQRSPTNRGIWAVPFSLERLETTGPPFLVVSGASFPSVSADGSLVYLAGDAGVSNQIVLVDRTGRELSAVGTPENGQELGPALSPDGTRVAIARGAEAATGDIWIVDAARGTNTRLTFDDGAEGAPVWSPSGDRVVYQARARDCPAVDCWLILTRAADGSGAADTIGHGVLPAISPDGRYATWSVLTRAGLDLVYAPLDRSQTPRPLVSDKGTQADGRVSPTGGYVAYSSDESGRGEVFLKRFPSGDGKWQLSVDGGGWARWNRKGDRLYYVRDDDIMEVAIETAGRPSPQVGTPHKLFTRQTAGSMRFGGIPAAFDVSGDGERFLVMKSVNRDTRDRSIVVMQNWLAAFKTPK